jgi:hypothetical protein
MSHKDEVKSMKLNAKSILLLMASIVILPACLLLPFMDHSNQLEPALSGSKTACMTNAALITHNLCSTWLEPQTIWPIALLFLAIVTLFGLSVNLYASRLPHGSGRRFADYRFVIVIFVAILSFMIFACMRIDSQNYDASNFGIVQDTGVERSGNITTGGPYTLVNRARFGYGLTPTMAVLLVGGLIVPALASWHQFTYSRNYIDGQRKQELFQ